MIFFGLRYYCPNTGKWISKDPAKQFLNSYLYCLNNPLVYCDPDGDFVPLAGLAAAAITVVGAMVTGAVYGATMGFVAGAATALVTGGNVLEGALWGAASGAVYGAVGGGLSVGLTILGACGFCCKFVAMTQGAIKWAGYVNMAVGAINAVVKRDPGYLVSTAIFLGGGYLTCIGCNPFAILAERAGRCAAGFFDARFGFRNHCVIEREVYNKRGDLVAIKSREMHYNDSRNGRLYLKA